jgi:hypothetical protein
VSTSVVEGKGRAAPSVAGGRDYDLGNAWVQSRRAKQQDWACMELFRPADDGTERCALDALIRGKHERSTRPRPSASLIGLL